MIMICALGTNERFFRPFSVNTDFTDNYVLVAKMSSGFFSGSNIQHHAGQYGRYDWG